MVNSNNVEHMKKILADKINSGSSRYEAIIAAQQELTTIQVGGRIRLAYDELNKAIFWESRHGTPGKVDQLEKLKREVPFKWAITKEKMMQLNDLLNMIVHEYWGANQSEIKKVA